MKRGTVRLRRRLYSEEEMVQLIAQWVELKQVCPGHVPCNRPLEDETAEADEERQLARGLNEIADWSDDEEKELVGKLLDNDEWYYKKERHYWVQCHQAIHAFKTGDGWPLPQHSRLGRFWHENILGYLKGNQVKTKVLPNHTHFLYCMIPEAFARPNKGKKDLDLV